MGYVVRSSGYVDEKLDLEQVVVKAEDGTPVQLSHVARIVEGPALRRGIVELNGEGETVSGIVVMRDGENALSVIERVKEKLDSLQRGLPEGVEIVTVYDRAPLIEGSVDYLKDKLIEEGIAVALVILIFLLHVRSSLVAIITLPLGVLGAFLIMSWQGVTANIMSLGGIAIAIGAMVDASIVLSRMPAGNWRIWDRNPIRACAARRWSSRLRKSAPAYSFHSSSSRSPSCPSLP